MSEILYLDTARLGTMSKGAREASEGFLHLVSQEPASSRLNEFLERGLQVFPKDLKERYPGLSSWQGLQGLKASLRRRAGTSPEAPVFLASRSLTLMRLSARLLAFHSGKVLTTDLEWPTYRQLVEKEGKTAACEVEVLPLRKAILEDHAALPEVVEAVTSRFQEKGCDGLFLSAVSFEGVRFPVREIVRSLREVSCLEFVVVDGAQALGHAPDDLGTDVADFYLSGCHKWLRAYHPLGVGLVGRPDSSDFVLQVCREMLEAGELDDPLLRFTSQRELGLEEGFCETVSIVPLFSAAASLGEDLAIASDPAKRFSDLVCNAAELEEAAKGTGFAPLSPPDAFRSGMVLFRAENPEVRDEEAEHLRSRFQERGVSLTAYQGGVVRLSARRGKWPSKDLDCLREALRRCA